jgi:GNAT superfamily N-acetyltransferase
MPQPPRLTFPTKVWYLEMASPADLRPMDGPGEVRRAHVPVGALNAFFYREVGRDHHWVDRAEWAPEAWQAWAERTELWLVHDRGTPAGYAELDPRPDGTADVAFFGVLSPFRGRGLGGQLLTQAIERAWELASDRVTVNTCELDGPHALRNYEARGFKVVRETLEDRARSAIL